MVESEKAILDSLAYPEASGDIPEIAAMLWQGKNRLDWQKLVGYAERYRSKSLMQRLGFLIDFAKIDLPVEASRDLQAQIGKNICYLGRVAKWGKGGKHDSTWQVVVNVPEAELQSEIQVT